MGTKNILLIFKNQSDRETLTKRILLPEKYQFFVSKTPKETLNYLQNNQPELILVDRYELDELSESISKVRQQSPFVQLIIFSDHRSTEIYRKALELGAADLLSMPPEAKEVVPAVRRAFKQKKELEKFSAFQIQRSTQTLHRKLDEFEALEKVSRSVSASLNLDNVLSTAVEAAVELTQADEGSLLLLDPETEELYIRAAKNIGEEIARTLRLAVEDTLAGQVVRTQKALIYNGSQPQEIQTAYFVENLLYVPLYSQDGVLGVMGVANRVHKTPFQENHLRVLTAIADYAAIAIEKARLYALTEDERRKLDTILNNIVDGVIVVDSDLRVILMNPIARETFEVSRRSLMGKPISEVVQHPDLLKILSKDHGIFPQHRELALKDGRILNAHAAMIPNVGLAVTLHDITQLKELDRIKNDFVSTVSHDLRSPLTAILGYIELLERVGPLNDTQRNFVDRVHLSVENITNLINELLDLGRIEAGFDTQKELFSIEKLLELTIEELREASDSKNQSVMLEITPNMPLIYASPTRIQQVFSNLIGNAIKYTQVKGWIKIRAHVEGKQVIIQVSDNGPGIPAGEQKYIFDRFYRASSSQQTTGTGLGLTIVKTIVDAHQGRIWVASNPGRGSVFTLMLPLKAAPETQTLSNQVF